MLYAIALAFAPFMESVFTQFFLLCSIEHKRKNWLFSDTPEGADSSALIYSIVETAKANGVNIYHYLKYLLEKTPSDKMSDEELESLLPWNPDVKNEISCRAAESNDLIHADE